MLWKASKVRGRETCGSIIAWTYRRIGEDLMDSGDNFGVGEKDYIDETYERRKNGSHWPYPNVRNKGNGGAQ